MFAEILLKYKQSSYCLIQKDKSRAIAYMTIWMDCLPRFVCEKRCFHRTMQLIKNRLTDSVAETQDVNHRKHEGN